MSAANTPLIRLPKSLAAWGSPDFEATFKTEVEQLAVDQLPLQQGLANSSYVTDSPRKVVIINVTGDEGFIRLTAGIFYAGVIAGCSCADDPTPVDEVTEYCQVRFAIDTKTAETTVELLTSQGEE